MNDEHDEHDLIDYLFDNLIFDFWSTVYYSRSTTPEKKFNLKVHKLQDTFLAAEGAALEATIWVSGS